MASESAEVLPSNAGETETMESATAHNTERTYTIIESVDDLFSVIKKENDLQPVALHSVKDESSDPVDQSSCVRVVNTLDELNKLLQHYQEITSCRFSIWKRSRLFGTNSGDLN